MSLNHIVLQGRMVRDPELRRTGSGVAVTSFTLAVDRDYNPKDVAEKETDFIDLVAFGATADHIAKWFTKGKMIIVSGRLQVRNWTDKEGNKRRSAEVVADSVYFGDSKKSTEGNSTYQAPNGSQASQNPFAETEALIAKYQAQKAQQSDYAMLEDPDAQLPF